MGATRALQAMSIAAALIAASCLLGCGGGGSPRMLVALGEVRIAPGDTVDIGMANSGSSLDTSFSVENIGNADLVLPYGVTLAGADATSFSATERPPSSLPSGWSGTWILRFSPTGSSGTRTVKVSLASNDPETPSFEFIARGYCRSLADN